MTRTAFYNNPRFRSAFYQLVVLAAVIWFGVEFAINARANLESKNVRFGFGFLNDPASFGISQTLISYSEQDTYRRVFFVGLLNTLLVAVLGIIFATILGFFIGLARLSPNWLLARLAGGYVELIRNLPLLFQILFWYLAVLLAVPGPRQSIGIGLQPLFLFAADGFAYLERFGAPGVMAQWWRGLADWAGPPAIYLNNRGLIDAARHLRRGQPDRGGGVRDRDPGRHRPARLGAAPAGRDRRALSGVVDLAGAADRIARTRDARRRIAGQLRGARRCAASISSAARSVIPEFTALLIGAHDLHRRLHRRGRSRRRARGAEGADRGGDGTRPAAQHRPAPHRGAAGDARDHPAADQPVSEPDQEFDACRRDRLPDLVAVFAGTTLNQTHQAIEIIAITMAVYLVISLATSLAMNIYNARIRLSER